MNTDRALTDLSKTGSTTMKVHGKSMEPIIKSGSTVTLARVPLDDLKVGDVVLCKVRRNFYVHKITVIQGGLGKRLFMIGNNKGHQNGWTRSIYGKVVDVVPPSAKPKAKKEPKPKKPEPQPEPQALEMPKPTPLKKRTTEPKKKLRYD